MIQNSVLESDKWLLRSGPDEHIAISSRARYARNLPRIPFPMRAGSHELCAVVARIDAAVNEAQVFADGLSINLSEIPAEQRNFLKENHTISKEMAKGGAHRQIRFDRSVSSAIMVNEEDHLRLYTIEPGLQLPSVLNKLSVLESNLEKHLAFAFSPRYGFLTSCPTNVGTGLRTSVLLHLPALSTSRRLAHLLKGLSQLGLTIRGPYGENSESHGDMYQVSNEVTFGRNENEIVSVLSGKVEEIITAEEEARNHLLTANRHETEDQIWRSWGLLVNARIITVAEAVQNLSRLRLGVDKGWFPSLTHNKLNRLIVDIQPGHTILKHMPTKKPGNQEQARATMLRQTLLV